MSAGQQSQVSQEREATASEGMAEKEITHAKLVEDLGPCAAQWEMLGTMLEIEDTDLEAIKGESNRVINCLKSVLKRWLQTKCSPNTKEQLLKVLRTRAMGPEERLAKEIEDNKDIPANFSQKDLRILIGSLDGIAARYQSFAIQLGVSYDAVKQLEHRVTNVKQYLEDMLSLWLKKGRPLSELVDAVRKPPIRNEVLARDLEEKYKRKKQDEDVDAPININ